MGSYQVRQISTVCYLDSNDLLSHQLLIALLEKSAEVQIHFLDNMPDSEIDEFELLSPYRMLPTLKERDLTLYHMPILIEFLEERYPQPPLLPVLPILRAQLRLMAYRIQRDWYPNFEKIHGCERLPTSKAIQGLLTGLKSIAVAFEEGPYLGSKEFSLLDVAVVPLLWRLSQLRSIWLNVPISIKKYANRIFSRPCVEGSIILLKRQVALRKQISHV